MRKGWDVDMVGGSNRDNAGRLTLEHRARALDEDVGGLCTATDTFGKHR